MRLPVLKAALLALPLTASLTILGCGGGGDAASRKITADGSSTVEPITKKMAEAFKKTRPDVNISVGTSGTGGGFKKFYNGEIDIANASRPIKESELAKCKEHGIEPLELKVALDGLAVIIHKDNTWAKEMTLEDLKKIWDPDIAAKKWKDVNPKWPDEKIDLYGPGTNSGTFDFFTEVVNGKEDRSRSDYTSSEDDNVIIKGVTQNKYALGYLGLAYYEANKDKLQVVAIKGKGQKHAVVPTSQTVESGEYPLSRPLFIYVKKASLKNPAVREFVQFYLAHPEIVQEVGYISLSEGERLEQRRRLEEALKEVAAGK